MSKTLASSRSVRSPTPFKPAKVTPLQTAYKHSLHAYQALCPWTPDGSNLLFLGFEETGGTADLVVRDLSTGVDTVVAQTRSYDYHTGAYQQWALGGRLIVYSDQQDGRRHCVALPFQDDPAEATRYPSGHVRAVSSNGLRGYGGVRAEGDNPAYTARIHFETGETEKFFSAVEAARHLPPDIAEECPFSFSHFVSSPDESRAFFKLSKPSPHRRIPGAMDDWGAFFIFDLQARTFSCLGQRISGHPHWMSDNRHIVTVMQPLDGSDNRWLVTQDALTGEVERLVDLPIEGPGHPVISPDGRYLATDAYTANHEVSPVYVIDLQTGQAAEIARFQHSVKPSQIYEPRKIDRSNLHPVWSPDGKQLLVNVNSGGTRLGMVLLEDFFS